MRDNIRSRRELQNWLAGQGVARETSRNRNFDDDFVIVTESESGEDSQLPEQEEEPIEEVDLVYVMDDEEQDDLEAQQHDGPDTRSNGVEEAQETRETGCDELALPENHEDTNRDTMTKAYDEVSQTLNHRLLN
ncbi:hypothetical protein M7I_0925 [Glarea lozoyensis 74030]|uniref:Uncharacterized protein n=1 Tax=Glarea lozoyensis (strain ATCC 74030 / MF5533) TaxID=1104152 RepID=H0EEP5_GLAL7|nr:hypothetical protein M7I_0925 [Glarea lozoyensis 74030]